MGTRTGMIAALIPVKGLESAKSRLAAALSDRQRYDLVLTLLQRTVVAVRACSGIDVIALVTPTRALADAFAAEWVPDEGNLNVSLERGVRWARARGAASVLILPADLPLLAAKDLAAMLAAAGDAPGVTIAPCLDGGTGALLLSPPDAIRPAFGPDSYARHAEQCRQRGMVMRTVRRDALARDLDRPEDLTMLCSRDKLSAR